MLQPAGAPGEPSGGFADGVSAARTCHGSLTVSLGARGRVPESQTCVPRVPRSQAQPGCSGVFPIADAGLRCRFQRVEESLFLERTKCHFLIYLRLKWVCKVPFRG